MYELIKKQLDNFSERYGSFEFCDIVNKKSHDALINLIKSHSIQLLEKEIEWLETKKIKYIEDAVSKHMEYQNFGYNNALSDQISHLKAEINKIKELWN